MTILEQLETEDLVEMFVREVWNTAQRDGWPVNAYLIGPEVFKGDFSTNWKYIRFVLNECGRRGLLQLGKSGEIKGVSETAKSQFFL